MGQLKEIFAELGSQEKLAKEVAVRGQGSRRGHWGYSGAFIVASSTYDRSADTCMMNGQEARGQM